MHLHFNYHKALYDIRGRKTSPRNTNWRKRIMRGYSPVPPNPNNATMQKVHAALNETLHEAFTDFSVSLGDIAFRFMPVSMKELLTTTKN